LELVPISADSPRPGGSSAPPAEKFRHRCVFQAARLGFHSRQPGADGDADAEALWPAAWAARGGQQQGGSFRAARVAPVAVPAGFSAAAVVGRARIDSGAARTQ